MYLGEKNMYRFMRIYDYKNDDSCKILIDRMWPRGISKDKIDLWFKDIAPSKEIVLNYHKDGNYDLFKERYFKELDSNKEIVNKFKDIINSKDTVLLFSSKNKLNNATVLKEYLERLVWTRKMIYGS